MYPYKFHPILKSTLWGGNKIIPFKRMKGIKQPHIGESWEISNVEGYDSIVSNGPEAGTSLGDLIKKHKVGLVGQENYIRFGNQFPLLVKFIDALEDLSIQVHPNDDLAQKRHRSMGKSEMWYVIDNNDENACLYAGFKEKMTPSKFTSMIADGTICNAIANYKVNPGDVFFLPAGRVHSIGAGCFIVEIQQTSDITYRIYDFNRKDKNGHTRELHTELAKDAINYQIENNYQTQYTPQKNEPVELICSSYFTTSIYDLTENMVLDYSELDSFVIFTCIEGECMLKDNRGNEETMHAGESILLPAQTTDVYVAVENQVKFLETYV